jgi:hypothetical protein
MQFLFIDDKSGFARIDMWLAALVSLTLCYLVSIIALLTALSLRGWDLTGALVCAIAIPVGMAFGLFWLFQPLRKRHF